MLAALLDLVSQSLKKTKKDTHPPRGGEQTRGDTGDLAGDLAGRRLCSFGASSG